MARGVVHPIVVIEHNGEWIKAKKCNMCKETRPLNTMYYYSKTRKRYNARCRYCESKKCREYAEAHREERRKAALEYYYANREERREYDRQYKAQTKEQRRAYDKENREHNNAVKRAWYARNKAHVLAYDSARKKRIRVQKREQLPLDKARELERQFYVRERRIRDAQKRETGIVD